MIYSQNYKNKEKIYKHRINLQKNNRNYTITVYVVQEKLQISIKYTENDSDEIIEYCNFYSIHQLQIINKYFRYFDNLENICNDLDKILKKNNVSIEEKNGFIILLITVLIKKEKTNIIFKLLKNKITDYHPSKNKLKAPSNALNNYSRNKNTISMPKYNWKDGNEIKSILNNFNDRISNLESSKYESIQKESKNKNNIKNINNTNNGDNNNLLLGNINNILNRINKLEDLNQEKDNKIKELEDKISKYEGNMSNTMSYPVYSLNDKSQKSKNDNNINNDNNNIKKKKNSKSEYEVEYRFVNENSINKSKGTNKLRNKKKIKMEESKDENNENNKLNSKKKFKNKNKTDSNYSRSNASKDYEEEEEEKNKNNNINNKHKRGNSDDSKESESNRNEEKKRKRKRGREEEKGSNSEENDKKEKDSSSEKEKINKKRRNSNNSNSSDKINNKKRRNSNNSNSSDKINNKKKRNSNRSNSSDKKKKEEKKFGESEQKLNEKKKLADLKTKTGLPMVEREDLKEYINSRIFFTKKELQLVKQKIVQNNRHKHSYFEILYRASLDGDYEDKIISCCEGIYPQLILFYTEDGARFGVYIEKQFSTNFFGSVSYKEVPDTAFLISLNNLKIYDIMKGQKATDDRQEKLCFGRSFYFNNNESNWFIYIPRNEFLGVKCTLGDKENSFGNIDANEIVGYKKDYILKEVEIFRVVVYSGDEDEETEDKYVREKEIKIRNFSKKHSDNDDTIKIKNAKIETEENE